MYLSPTINRWYIIVSLGFLGYLVSWALSIYSLQLSILLTGSIFVLLGFITGKSDVAVNWGKLALLNIFGFLSLFYCFSGNYLTTLLPFSAISFSIIGTTLRSEWWASRDKRLTILVFLMVLITLLITNISLPSWIYDNRISLVKEKFDVSEVRFKDSLDFPIKKLSEKVVVLTFFDPTNENYNSSLTDIKVIRHFFRNETGVVFFRVNNSSATQPSKARPLPIIIDSLDIFIYKYKIGVTPAVVVVSKKGNTALVHQNYSIDEDFRHNLQKTITHALFN